MTDTRTVKSSEIKVGDIVRAHGMRVRIDETHVHEDANTYGGVFHAHLGTVINLAEVLAAKVVPAGFLTRDEWVEGQGWTITRRDAWTIQGNDLATWLVEVPEPVKPQLPQIGDRGYFQGFSVVVEDIDTSGPFPRAHFRYAATNRTEWVAADAFSA